MSLPAEITRMFAPGAHVSAHAAISSSPGSSIGETRLVVIDGQLLAFVRESLIGDYTPLPLDATFHPVMEGGDFSARLLLRAADGAPLELKVSSFESSDVTRLLAALPAPVAPVSVAVATFLPPAPATALPQPLPTVAPATPNAAPARTPEPTPTPRVSVPEPKPPANGEWKNDFAGDSPFLTGCLPSLIFVVAAGVGLWHLEGYLRVYVYAATNWDFLFWGFTGFVMKAVAIVLALVASAYFGMWLDALNFRMNTTGKVTIKAGQLTVLAPKAAWKHTFALKRARIEYQCRSRDTKEDASESASCEALITLTEGGLTVGLVVNAVPWKDIAGSHWQAAHSIAKPDTHLPFLGTQFSNMHARLLHELHQNRLA